MKVAYFQFSPRFGKPEANRARLAEALERSRADLLVAPELSTSGYFFPDSESARSLAETVPGPSTELLEETARKTGSTIVFGLPEREGDTLYNSAVVLGPQGIVATYRKVHLFNEETIHFTPGNDGFLIFQLQGVKIGVLVCFDHMFPEAARSLALQGVQVVCHPSNLVLPEYGQLTSRVRALENRMFWVLCNRWGEERVEERRLRFTGVSQIVHPKGEILARAEAEGDQIATTEIDPEEATEKFVTPFNHLLEDRRPEFYRL
ncbi:MAG TPA: nitrilase [Sediminispirochaeta sp.]|nr:nitrilase [Sediminispirochaeta sp.]